MEEANDMIKNMYQVYYNVRRIKSQYNILYKINGILLCILTY